MATPIPENRASFTLGEIAAATGGELVALDPATRVVGVATDSRAVPAGGLFVALVGESQDGHAFAPAARARGAVALVARGARVEGPRIEVDATLAALGALARAYVERERRDDPLPVLAIGGAAGKTTTKTLAAAAVAALFGPTLVTRGNLNNRIGVPMTLLALAPGDRAAVLECGTSEPGEIAALAAIARPEVAVVTNVDVEHSERLGALAAIADEEAALLWGASRFAIANADDPLLVARLGRAGARRLTFGDSPAADLRLAGRAIGGDGTAVVSLRPAKRLLEALGGGGEGAGDSPPELSFSTRLLGATAAGNVAAAVLGAIALHGRWPSAVEWERLRSAIGSVEAVPGRLAPLEVALPGGSLLVLDDTYNSNPRSVAAALAAARELASRRGSRLVVALGDMLELGDLAPSAHLEMVRAADDLSPAALLLVGAETSRAVESSAGSLRSPRRVFASSTGASAAILGMLRPGDLLLVKGSRGMRMERLIEALVASAPPQP